MASSNEGHKIVRIASLRLNDVRYDENRTVDDECFPA